jgi:hypothetical protein
MFSHIGTCLLSTHIPCSFADLVALIFIYLFIYLYHTILQRTTAIRTISLHSYEDITQQATSYFFFVACNARHVCFCSQSQAKVKLESYMRYLFCPKDGSSRFLRIVVNFYQFTWCHYTSCKPTTHNISGLTYCMLYLFLVIQTRQMPRISCTIQDISLFWIFFAGPSVK